MPDKKFDFLGSVDGYDTLLQDLNETLKGLVAMSWAGDEDGIPTGALRFNSNKFQQWSGTTWVDISFANLMMLVGNQTVAGVKTFSSIPVLPASNPTTDNQAVRKKYADDTFEPKITKNTGFNLDKTDSYSTDNTNLLATAKALKALYDYINTTKTSIRVHRGTSQLVSNDDEDVIIFNYKEKDSKTEYDTATGIATLKTAGSYSFSGNIRYYTAVAGGTMVHLRLYVNSTVVMHLFENVDTEVFSNRNGSFSFSTDYDISENDQVKLTIQKDDTSAANIQVFYDDGDAVLCIKEN